MDIYVGNLSREVGDAELREAFAAYGEVASVRVIKDRLTGEPRGFGFVDMPDQAQAQAAISGLNGSQLKGQTLTVNESRPRQERPSGYGDRGQRGGGRRW